MYRVYDVKIRKEDRKRAEKILLKHWNDGDIDAMRADDREKESVTYWIEPYVYEDLETIISEFKEAGIQVL